MIYVLLYVLRLPVVVARKLSIGIINFYLQGVGQFHNTRVRRERET